MEEIKLQKYGFTQRNDKICECTFYHLTEYKYDDKSSYEEYDVVKVVLLDMNKTIYVRKECYDRCKYKLKGIELIYENGIQVACDIQDFIDLFRALSLSIEKNGTGIKEVNVCRRQEFIYGHIVPPYRYKKFNFEEFKEEYLKEWDV